MEFAFAAFHLCEHQRKITSHAGFGGGGFAFAIVCCEEVKDCDLLRREENADNREDKAAIPESLAEPVGIWSGSPRKGADNCGSEDCRLFDCRQ